jgi:DNA replication protein DnaC
VTIYTTNLTKDELQKKLNERIVSRMLYNTDVVVFKGDDLRLKTTQYFDA